MKFFAVFAAVLALAAAAPTTHWTLNDLSHAIENPATPAAVLPYLEQALNNMMAQLFAGQSVDSVVVATPVGLLPVEAIASPAIVMPAIVEEPASPIPVVEPTPAAVITDVAGSPLVQIIVNIVSESEVAAPEAPATAVEPSPVEASPVIVVDEAAPSPVLIPEPVIVAPAPAPVVIPEPIVVVPAPAPIVIPEANPIDIIAVGAPEVNPIDLLQPVPVAVAAGDSHHGIIV